jgi:hypothetical protein
MFSQHLQSGGASATGTAVDKTKVMELSVPVGEKNKLSVRIEVGKVLITATISQIADVK